MEKKNFFSLSFGASIIRSHDRDRLGSTHPSQQKIFPKRFTPADNVCATITSTSTRALFALELFVLANSVDSSHDAAKAEQFFRRFREVSEDLSGQIRRHETGESSAFHRLRQSSAIGKGKLRAEQPKVHLRFQCRIERGRGREQTLLIALVALDAEIDEAKLAHAPLVEVS